jgi:hypothetical protein
LRDVKLDSIDSNAMPYELQTHRGSITARNSETLHQGGYIQCK